MEFPWQQKEHTDTKKVANSKDFWESAKAAHEQLFADFVERAGDDFDSWDDFIKALRKASWKMQEELAKQSYRNGVTRGRGQKAEK